MRYENIKSILLIILVFVSVFLTWNLWTYQPNYETMEKSKNVAEVTLSEKQEVKKIIKPDMVIFHIKGEHHGTVNPVELDKISKDLSQWVFYDVRNYSNEVRNVNDIGHGNGNVEIIFPSDTPIELYRNVLNFQEKRLPSFTFDRIIINVDNPEKENGVVYFLSTNTQQVYISHISLSLLNNFNRIFYKNSERYPRYLSFRGKNNHLIFFPEGKTDVMRVEYLPVTINSEKFKDALFSDPSFVQKSTISQKEEEYTNGSSKMSINNSTNMLLYVNPTSDTEFTDNPKDLVKRSIDFVNEHGGWTDAYRYVDMDEYNHQATFRFYSMDGYPVFNEDGMSEINEIWGKNEINKYIRPNISLEQPLKSEMQKVTCPSGSEALEFLKEKKNFKSELLQNLVLGYQMEKDVKEPRLVYLEPAWFYQYDGKWGMINLEDLGGVQHGLE
ncbi:MAG: two-component system activity regulator YycH [Bacillota bacterium]|nr:two-component system activity regulator YycH [Bacillota bacterium]